MGLCGPLEIVAKACYQNNSVPWTHCLSAVSDQDMLMCAHFVADFVRNRAAHDEDTGQFWEGDREVFEEVSYQHPCLEQLAPCGCPADAAARIISGLWS